MQIRGGFDAYDSISLNENASAIIDKVGCGLVTRHGKMTSTTITVADPVGSVNEKTFPYKVHARTRYRGH